MLWLSTVAAVYLSRSVEVREGGCRRVAAVSIAFMAYAVRYAHVRSDTVLSGNTADAQISTAVTRKSTIRRAIYNYHL